MWVWRCLSLLGIVSTIHIASASSAAVLKHVILVPHNVKTKISIGKGNAVYVYDSSGKAVEQCYCHSISHSDSVDNGEHTSGGYDQHGGHGSHGDPQSHGHKISHGGHGGLDNGDHGHGSHQTDGHDTSYGGHSHEVLHPDGHDTSYGRHGGLDDDDHGGYHFEGHSRSSSGHGGDGDYVKDGHKPTGHSKSYSSESFSRSNSPGGQFGSEDHDELPGGLNRETSDGSGGIGRPSENGGGHPSGHHDHELYRPSGSHDIKSSNPQPGWSKSEYTVTEGSQDHPNEYEKEYHGHTSGHSKDNYPKFGAPGSPSDDHNHHGDSKSFSRSHKSTNPDYAHTYSGGSSSQESGHSPRGGYKPNGNDHIHSESSSHSTSPDIPHGNTGSSNHHPGWQSENTYTRGSHYNPNKHDKGFIPHGHTSGHYKEGHPTLVSPGSSSDDRNNKGVSSSPVVEHGPGGGSSLLGNDHIISRGETSSYSGSHDTLHGNTGSSKYHPGWHTSEYTYTGGSKDPNNAKGFIPHGHTSGHYKEGHPTLVSPGSSSDDRNNKGVSSSPVVEHGPGGGSSLLGNDHIISRGETSSYSGSHDTLHGNTGSSKYHPGWHTSEYTYTGGSKDPNNAKGFIPHGHTSGHYKEGHPTLVSSGSSSDDRNNKGVSSSPVVEHGPGGGSSLLGNDHIISRGETSSYNGSHDTLHGNTGSSKYHPGWHTSEYTYTGGSKDPNNAKGFIQQDHTSGHPQDGHLKLISPGSPSDDRNPQGKSYTNSYSTAFTSPSPGYGGTGLYSHSGTSSSPKGDHGHPDGTYLESSSGSHIISGPGYGDTATYSYSGVYSSPESDHSLGGGSGPHGNYRHDDSHPNGQSEPYSYSQTQTSGNTGPDGFSTLYRPKGSPGEDGHGTHLYSFHGHQPHHPEQQSHTDNGSQVYAPGNKYLYNYGGYAVNPIHFAGMICPHHDGQMKWVIKSLGYPQLDKTIGKYPEIKFHKVCTVPC